MTYYLDQRRLKDEINRIQQEDLKALLDADALYGDSFTKPIMKDIISRILSSVNDLAVIVSNSNHSISEYVTNDSAHRIAEEAAKSRQMLVILELLVDK